MARFQVATIVALLLLTILSSQAHARESHPLVLSLLKGWAEPEELAARSESELALLDSPGVRTPGSPPFLDWYAVSQPERPGPPDAARSLVHPIDLDQYQYGRLERRPAWQAFMQGRYGIKSWRHSPRLLPLSQTAAGWQAVSPALTGRLKAAALLQPVISSRPAETPVTARDCRPRLVTLLRNDGERDRLALLNCAGAVTADAVDRVSVMARPPRTPRPAIPLPLTPDPAAVLKGEWVDQIRLVHPRLIWALSQISKRFPGRAIHIVSGYRPLSKGSRHRNGRALDLRVIGVTNEALFALCRRLPDVGCGYYPNSTFVHIDVRPLDAGHAFWVDVSGPGEPAQYVDSWPGVVERKTRARS